jgi:hypothetical protein
VLIISAGELGARRLLKDIRRIATGTPLLAGSVLDDHAELLTLSNGSEIRSVPASERAIRGWQVDLLLIDEAGSPSADIILSAALPTVTARPHARVVLADTAWAAQGPFYDLAVAEERGDVDVRSFKWVAKAAGGEQDAPWVTPSVIRIAREAMGAVRFAAEHLCEFSSGMDAMFSRDVLRRASAPLLLPGLRELEGPARLLGGCDWGATYDRCAHVSYARLPVGLLNPDVHRPVLCVAAVKAWPAGEALSDVAEAIAASPAHWHTLSTEVNGIGHGPSQHLGGLIRRREAGAGGGRGPGFGPPPSNAVQVGIDSRGRRYWSTRCSSGFEKPWERQWTGTFKTRVHLVTTSAELKSQTYSTMRYLMERGQLVIPADTPLVRELLALRVELRAGGGVGIEAAPGSHDDLADAAMIAAAPYRTKEKQPVWRSLLGDAAGTPSRDTTAAIDEPVVETGDGLRLYRRPVIQSVLGPEITLPRGAREVPYGATREGAASG